jgi:hypothetical protein
VCLVGVMAAHVNALLALRGIGIPTGGAASDH